jgi:tetratricopeptide (TPR) repeat protein
MSSKGKNYVLNEEVYYNKKAILILDPWRIPIESEGSERINTLDKEQIQELYRCLSSAESNLGVTYYNLRDFNKAGSCYDRAVSYAKNMAIGKERTADIYEALTKKARSSSVNFDKSAAKAAYEETYELLADAYDPYHPKALKIVSLMIPILLDLREFKDAERYARQLYDSLTKPIDNESKEVAKAADCLASVIYNVVGKNEID